MSVYIVNNERILVDILFGDLVQFYIHKYGGPFLVCKTVGA